MDQHTDKEEGLGSIEISTVDKRLGSSIWVNERWETGAKTMTKGEGEGERKVKCEGGSILLLFFLSSILLLFFFSVTIQIKNDIVLKFCSIKLFWFFFSIQNLNQAEITKIAKN